MSFTGALGAAGTVRSFATAGVQAVHSRLWFIAAKFVDQLREHFLNLARVVSLDECGKWADAQPCAGAWDSFAATSAAVPLLSLCEYKVHTSVLLSLARVGATRPLAATSPEGWRQSAPPALTTIAVGTGRRSGCARRSVTLLWPMHWDARSGHWPQWPPTTGTS